MWNLKKKFVIIVLCSTFLILAMISIIRLPEYDIVLYNITTECSNCSMITMNQLRAFGMNNTFRNGVPKIVHYDYKSSMVPEQYITHVKRCLELNPDVMFVMWSDVTSYYLVRDQYHKYFAIFQSYFRSKAHPLKKSDLIRYFILDYFGGIYMDLDTRCQKPLEKAMVRDSCILSREAEVQTRIISNYDFLAMNSFMACVAHHAFYNHLIKNIVLDSEVDLLKITGPLFLTDVFVKYNASLNATDRSDPFKYVTVPSSDIFSPLVEDYCKDLCKKPVGKWKTIGCRDLDNYLKTVANRTRDAVVVHLFLHLGYKYNYHKIVKYVNIGDLNDIHIIV